MATTLKRKKKHKSAVHWPTPAQMKKLMTYLRTQYAENPTLRNHSNLVMLSLLYYGALRIQEMCSLDFEDTCMFHNESKLHIRHGKGDKARWVILPVEINNLLMQYMATERGATKDSDPHTSLFIGRPYQLSKGDVATRKRPKVMWETIRLIGEKCGFAGANHLHPHSLRHAGASLHYAQGQNLKATQEMLGHTNLGTTARYLHVTADQFAAIAEKMAAATQEDD